MAKTIHIYDTTLRDGCQAEDIALTLEDKLRIAERLDDFGIDYVEGGWPGSNPRDEAFFQAVKQRKLTRIRVAAFGSTRRAGARASDDRNLEKLLRADTPVVTIFGKSWDLHVRDDLRIPLAENFDLIHDTIRYLKRHVDEVVYDAEHFFDGYRANPEFALECLRVAADAGADVLCLCDTNGGRMPWEIAAAVDAVRAQGPTPIGIHCHNDSELAVANSLIAVEHGAIQVQGTINGIGERCGNVNLCSVIANLQLKMGYHVVSAANLRRLHEVSRFVDELANVEPSKRQPYVGQSAFAHKGGVHVAAVQRNPRTYEHIDPALVGNTQRVLVSDLSGRANIVYKARQFGVDMEALDGHVKHLLQEVKQLEHQGYQFEGAEASLELRMHRIQHGELRYFELVQFRVVDEKGYMRLVFGDNGSVAVRTDERIEHGPASAWAAVMLKGPTGDIEHTAAEGNGPVNALDTALRRALRRFYPDIEAVRLLDYKVRVLSGAAGSAAPVRVLMESADDVDRWGTVGVSLNVIEASWQALVDSFEYKLYKDGKRSARRAPRARSRRP
ncbi:citramalate synthase [bacterium]|nr:citramalate synthase [bacterium]